MVFLTFICESYFFTNLRDMILLSFKTTSYQTYSMSHTFLVYYGKLSLFPNSRSQDMVTLKFIYFSNIGVLRQQSGLIMSFFLFPTMYVYEISLKLNLFIQKQDLLVYSIYANRKNLCTWTIITTWTRIWLLRLLAMEYKTLHSHYW